MAHRDLREFTDALQSGGDLVTIDDEVDWDQELAGIGRLSCERDGPAFMFNNVKDYAGWRVLANPVTGWRRYAVALGLPAGTPIRELYKIYAQREQNPIQPILVNSSPCKEVIIPKSDIDLFDLPVPMVHDGDGGRYLGTWDLVISKDRDTGWVNWGMYRFMVHDEHHLTGYPRPNSHLGKMLLDGYAPAGEPMPIAIVIGADQPSHLSATATFRMGGDEVELAGGLGERAVELIKCETSDLFVPASAEIVVEAEIYPDKIAQEGPYGEYPGYRSGEMGNSVCARVTAITHRRDPIFTIDTTGFMDSSAVTTSISGAIAIRRRLERYDVPVAEVYIPPESGVHMAIVSVTRGGPDVARQVVEILTARRALMSKVIVVDDDVDVFNMSAVIHAFSTKCHPDRGTHIHRYEGRANALTPAYSQEERVNQLGASVAFDATWPPDWPAGTTPIRATLDSMYTKDVQDRVNARWKKLGL
jgi:4-hydroxy-3-polyprenylbenzoate decarboxylase